MKTLRSLLQTLAAFVLLALVSGCATSNNTGLANRESMLLNAGFKIITPNQPDQRALLVSLPANQISPITYHGKPYYVLPDVDNDRAFVGGPQQYQFYKANRAAQKLSNDNIEAAQWNRTVGQMNNWGGWSATGFDD